MRLNRYISSSGLCSRRKADTFIKKGLVVINNNIVKKFNFKVSKDDIVYVNKKFICPNKKRIYIVFNKPVNIIVSRKDVMHRKIIFDFLPHKILHKYGLHYIGRLDFNSSGVILLTNNGFLTQKLSHPKHNITKEYLVVLNKNLHKQHLSIIKKGVVLKEGVALIDNIKILNHNKKKIIINLHIGWNRIIRRIFKIFNYKILSLERLSFAGITNYNIKAGCWRYLNKKEIQTLLNT